ncbi:glycosyltransferase family 2 protein [Saccharopolyspora sp. MS10]|uniref:glycosyltransferase family 2 protein n=1 Tax=Saccharopolyspora sp. MS10 TaxID=3385973 RepID=UPI0039A2EB1E
MTTSVDVILPCRDEEAALPGVLAGLPVAHGYRALVVDNGSTDGTAEVAAAHGATVISEARPGYGAAVHAGLEHSGADVVVFVDADGSMRLEQLPRLVDLLVGGDADLVVGRRVAAERGAFPWHARLGNAALAGMLRRQGLPVRDLAPLRVAWRQRLLDLGVTDRGFGYPLELLVRAARSGWRVQEVPVDYYPRAAGTRSKVTGSVRGTARAVRDMARVLR